MMSGIAACWKATYIVGMWRVVGCFPERSAVMYECARHGRVTAVARGDTMLDGSAGVTDPRAQIVPLSSALVDAYALVSEADIAAAMVRVLSVQRLEMLENIYNLDDYVTHVLRSRSQLNPLLLLSSHVVRKLDIRFASFATSYRKISSCSRLVLMKSKNMFLTPPS